MHWKCKSFVVKGFLNNISESKMVQTIPAFLWNVDLAEPVLLQLRSQLISTVLKVHLWHEHMAIDLIA